MAALDFFAWSLMAQSGCARARAGSDKGTLRAKAARMRRLKSGRYGMF
jgi:hypothetical protein